MPQPLSAGFYLETQRPEETEALGACLGGLLAHEPLPRSGAARVLELKGELGAGKTVFVRGLARGLLPHTPVAVTSPTYVLLHVYRGRDAVLYHIDAYRLKGGLGEFEASGLGECLRDPKGVVCLEWPERLAEASLNADALAIELEHQGETQRGIHVAATGERSARLVDALIAAAGTREKLLAAMGSN